MTFKHTTGLLRYQGFQEKCKRLTKVVKVKLNNEIMASLTPNEPKTTKKSKTSTILALWPLVWPFRPLSAFYIFPEILDTKEDQWYA